MTNKIYAGYTTHLLPQQALHPEQIYAFSFAEKSKNTICVSFIKETTAYAYYLVLGE